VSVYEFDVFSILNHVYGVSQRLDGRGHVFTFVDACFGSMPPVLLSSREGQNGLVADGLAVLLPGSPR